VNNGYFTLRPYTFLIISLSVLRMRDVSDKSCRENRNTHFVFIKFFYWHLLGYVEKYCRAGQATDGSMVAHVHCLLDK